MKTVALISGGKDSLYAAWECVRNGHQITCLGNLVPSSVEQQEEGTGVKEGTTNTELDSFCFQSVGSECAQLIAKCMELPLIQEQFQGRSVQQSLHYDHRENTEEDEVEVLYKLLK